MALEAIKVPAGIDDFGRRLAEAQKAQLASHEAAIEAYEAFEAAQTARTGLPERALIEAAVAVKHGQHETLVLAVKAGEAKVAEAARKLEAAAVAVEKAEASAVEAEETSKRLERADSAYHASQGLKAGDICPVCGEKLTGGPNWSSPRA